MSMLGRLGVWTFFDGMPMPQAAAVAKRIEAWGYPSLWLPEAIGRDPFVLIAHLGAHTERLVFATGIANIYARDAMAMNTLRLTTGESTGGRFVLGIGVSHGHLVAGVRGHTYEKPVSTMRAYLDGMAKALYMAPKPAVEPPIVLAALRPKMLALAAEKAAGADHVCIQPLHPDGLPAPDEKVLELLAPAKS